SNGNAAIFPIILMQTLGAQVMHWIFTKMHSSIIPLSRLQSLYFFLGITCAFSILFGFLHNLSANIEFMFAYYLSFLLLTPVCLIWDHDTLKRKNFLSKHKIGLALNLMFLFCCGSLLFAYSTLYSLLLFIGILLCVIAGYVMCGQWGGVILGMQLSIFLIAIPEMPMYEIWENSIDISILQVSICLSVILGLSFSTFRKETYFKNYLRHHPVLL
ncbi:MAG TPA: hypothetical protein VFP93_02175, partial [Gammaproteobacteria bacterium]|nr:hypothetical protein [Gammaproteobacteria bacterium]